MDGDVGVCPPPLIVAVHSLKTRLTSTQQSSSQPSSSPRVCTRAFWTGRGSFPRTVRTYVRTYVRAGVCLLRAVPVGGLRGRLFVRWWVLGGVYRLCDTQSWCVRVFPLPNCSFGTVSHFTSFSTKLLTGLVRFALSASTGALTSDFSTKKFLLEHVFKGTTAWGFVLRVWFCTSCMCACAHRTFPEFVLC